MLLHDFKVQFESYDKVDDGPTRCASDTDSSLNEMTNKTLDGTVVQCESKPASELDAGPRFSAI